MKARSCFSAIAATVLMVLSATPAMAQQTGKIRFVGAIVNQGCGTAQHGASAYSAQEKLNFDLQLNDCLSEVQSAVGVSIDAMDIEGERLTVSINTQASGMGVVVSPVLEASVPAHKQVDFYLGGEGKVTPLDINYHNPGVQTDASTDKVYVILNLSYA